MFLSRIVVAIPGWVQRFKVDLVVVRDASPGFFCGRGASSAVGAVMGVVRVSVGAGGLSPFEIEDGGLRSMKTVGVRFWILPPITGLCRPWEEEEEDLEMWNLRR
jgi:hypothetical protein